MQDSLESAGDYTTVLESMGICAVAEHSDEGTTCPKGPRAAFRT